MSTQLEKTKEVTLGENRFLISKFNPRIGSWILSQLMTLSSPQLDSQLSVVGGIPLPQGRASMSEAEFYGIQNHCLNVISVYKQTANSEAAVPLLMQDGRFTVEIDFVDVTALTVHALLFNAQRFFLPGEKEKLLESFTKAYPDSPLIKAIASTLSSGGR